MNPLISIIIPAYNASEFILETLESVKYQTYTNWEIILVNDCSTDNTIEIVNQFSEEVTNEVKIFTNKKNSGVSISRNNAVIEATGDWLALLDSDDLWLPTHLEKLINTISKDSKIKMAYSGCLVFMDNVDDIIFKQEINDKMLSNFNVSLFTHQIGINPCTAIIERKAWEALGGMIQEVHPAEDKEFFFRLAKFGNRFAFSGEHTALYRKHSNESAASNNTAKMLLATINIFEKHFDWKEIPLKIRKDQLANAYLSYARLIHKKDINSAKQYSFKAFNVKKSFINGSYFVAFKISSILG